MNIDRATIERKIADATAVRNSAHRDYMEALHSGQTPESGPAWIALGAAHRALDARKAERVKIITSARPESPSFVVDADPSGPEEAHSPDALTFDLSRWELRRLCMVLDEEIAEDQRRGLSGEGAKRLREIFTTDGTVSVTVRPPASTN